jgi:hypothetical protein
MHRTIRSRDRRLPTSRHIWLSFLVASSSTVGLALPALSTAASTAHACHISAKQGYANVIGTVEATGLSCTAAKPVVASVDRARIKGFGGPFTHRVSGQTWRCRWARTSDSTLSYKCSAGTKKLAWNFGQP